MTDGWTAMIWRFIRTQLPDPPARVIELGCGPHGGLVPMLQREGYDAVGVDPQAPEAGAYQRVEFERYRPPQPVHAVVASAALHHVGDVGLVLDRVAAALVPGGALAVAEWAWERFDEPTARWCFARLGAADGEPGWLHQRREEWIASGLGWDTYREGWAAREHCHSGQVMLRELDTRFDRRTCTRVPYFFHDLAGTTETAEQAAIDCRAVQATGIRYAALLRHTP